MQAAWCGLCSLAKRGTGGKAKVLQTAATCPGVPMCGSPGARLEGAQEVLTVLAICRKRSHEYPGKQVRSCFGDDAFSQALFFPSLFLAGFGGQFLLTCPLACLRDLIAALPARAFIAQLADQMQPCTWSYRQACPGPSHPH